MIDNVYGKIGRFIKASGHDDNTRVAADFAAGRAMADKLLSERSAPFTDAGKSGASPDL